MAKLTLKNIVTGKLDEYISEPSEQILKGAMALFKQSTGLNPSYPVFKFRNKRTDTLVYESTMNKEIRTSLMKLLFTDITLKISVNELENVIGGYEFSYVIGVIHSNGAEDDIPVGTIKFKDNKYFANFK